MGRLSHGNFNGRDLLILGHLYPLEVLREMAREARSTLVIAGGGAVELARDIQSPAIGWDDWISTSTIYENDDHRLAAILDPSRSTAGLTWDYLMGGGLHRELDIESESSSSLDPPTKTRPRIINLIEDRFLGRFKYGDETRAFHAVLASYDWTDLPTMFRRLDRWQRLSSTNKPLYFITEDDTLHEAWKDVILCEGEAILRAQAQVIRSVLESRGTIKIAGHIVPCANVPPSMAGEVGRFLCDTLITTTGYDRADGDHSNKLAVKSTSAFVATYHDNLAAGRRRFTLHSPEGGADVGEIAKQEATWLNEHFKYNSPVGGFHSGGTARSATFDAPLGWQGE